MGNAKVDKMRIPAVSILVLLLTSGCRTAGTPAEQDSRPGQGEFSNRSTEVPASPRMQEAGPVPLPDLVRQVSYQQPEGHDSEGTLESLPIPTEDPLPRSDMTLADLEAIALGSNPALAEASARVCAARGNWLQVGLPPNPVLGYSGQQLGSHGEAEQQGVYLGQEVITGKKLKLNRQVAAWEIQRARREFEAFRLRVLTDVRIGYYDVLIAQRRLEVAKELVRISKQGLQTAQALFEGAEVSEADPLRASVVAGNASIVLQNSINQHREAWRRLAAVLGMPEMELQRLAGELKPKDLCVTWREELDHLLTASPELAAAMANVEAAQWAVRRASAQVIPNVDVQAIFQDDRGTGSNNGNLQLSVPLPIWNRNQGGICRARAEVAAARRAVDRMTLDLQSRLAVTFQRYESARNQVEQYSRQGGIIDNSRRTLELVRVGYQAEEFGLLDLVTAQRTYFETNLAYLDSLRELAASVMEIRGLLLRGSLSQSPSD